MNLEFRDVSRYDIILEISSLIDVWIGNVAFFNLAIFNLEEATF